MGCMECILTESLVDTLRQFPPGDTSWKNKQPQSKWREIAFVLHQVKRAIEPLLSLRDVLNGWNEIAKALAGSSRKEISAFKLF